MSLTRARLRMSIRATVALLLATALAGCSLVGSGDGPSGGKDVVLVTHDSFVLP
jgi:hypothetical protein